MTLLQKLVYSVQANVGKYEAALEHGHVEQPHLWEARPHLLDNPANLPPREAGDYLNQILTDLRAIESIITPSHQKLLETGFGAIKGAALSTAAKLGVSDFIESHGGSATLEQLSQDLNVNENKLGRMLRILTADYIYCEPSLNVFENTRHSMAILKQSQAEYFLSLATGPNAISATGLYKDLTAEDTRSSFDPVKSAFSRTYLQRDESFAQYVMSPAGSDLLNDIISGVVPWLNRVTRGPLLHDFPWRDLENITVVDVGAGPGDSGFDILRLNPKLKWIFQDLPAGVKAISQAIPSDMKDRVDSGQVQLVVQDFFDRNLSRGEIWYIRGVLRELDDELALKVLRNIAEAMRDTPGSRLIINEALCTAPVYKPPMAGEGAIPSGCIPPNQTHMPVLGNLMTMSATLFYAGKERSYEEMEKLLNSAGFVISQLYILRTITSVLECTIRD
ncbi:S-adenosyl-L-methionine-dependent methyltransferase [Aspergillus pseudodeflectus]|uniref:S-adenosyl-L-methionine-dependent methyltransferase n=1 Tax=Aspergillus pseudodeflectus TaxID=176178 RepID=A0ABR4JCM8_9EURO